ncbi:Fanconi anemia core complex-associated protein 24 isoform X2 [Octodon degus]|uniref:Fanconi anemia core complex-associated protein 24 isoform X2 n=1 Tax=Octodon degus TaxID=10160 RepID=A0A6P6EYC0_OCTDE|nr:Fanconi anemia core complex-associated protein 24 isoform X2 [Octodon degus]
MPKYKDAATDELFSLSPTPLAGIFPKGARLRFEKNVRPGRVEPVQLLPCISYIRSRPPMNTNPSDSASPMHVPLGHIVANEKWRGSQLAQEMQGKIKLVFEDGLTMVDFYLSSRSCILYITEADLVAGNGYRKRLVRVRNVQEQTKEPSKNPFLRKRRAALSEPFLLRTVQQIPGVGKVKALLLLQKFPSIQQLSNASIQELEPVVGQAAAQQIHAFFTQSR